MRSGNRAGTCCNGKYIVVLNPSPPAPHSPPRGGPGAASLEQDVALGARLVVQRALRGLRVDVRVREVPARALGCDDTPGGGVGSDGYPG